MVRHDAAVGLRDLFRHELASRLAPDGWSPVEVASQFQLAAFVCPLEDEFAATAQAGCGVRIPDRPPLGVANLYVGVSYEPLRRLAPLLGDSARLSVLRCRLREDDGGGQLAPLRVASAAEARSVADEVAELFRDRAVAFATPYTQLDALLSALGGGDGPSRRTDERYPALLAAAGRLDEAQAALERFEPERHDPATTREAERFARQLRRWIDSGADPSLLSDEGLPPRSRPAEPQSLSEAWLVAEKAKRGWLERLGLKASDPGPDDWVAVTSGRRDAEFSSSSAEKIVGLLSEAGIQADAKPYLLPDDSALSGITGTDGPGAQARVRVAVLVRRRDQTRAEEITRGQPIPEPISDEELSRLAEEAGPPPE